MQNRKPLPAPPPGRLEDIHARYERERATAPAPRAVPAAPTSAGARPQSQQPSRPAPRKTDSGIRPKRTRTIAATVDAVVADMSNDPRFEED